MESSTGFPNLLALESAWADLDTTWPQIQVLFLAVANESPTGSYIQRRLHMLPSTLTRIIDRLEADGLVERYEGIKDRRQVHYRATEAGRARVLGLLSPP